MRNMFDTANLKDYLAKSDCSRHCTKCKSMIYFRASAQDLSSFSSENRFNKLSESERMSHVMRKSTFCICENKDADQLRGNREADQRLCFRYIDSTIPLLSKSEISGLRGGIKKFVH